MTERANPFGDLGDFAPAPAKPKTDRAVIDQVAEAHGFPSRQPAKQPGMPEPTITTARQQRRRRTGRNAQINIKATPEAIEHLYRLADHYDKPLGEILEMALASLEKNGT